MNEEKYTFFWNGPFSQWSKSPFMDLHGILYNTAEQYMMAQKAILFRDMETYLEIMKTTQPRDQKSLGRKVKNFNEKVWNVYSTMIVLDGNLLKFSQNKKHQDALLATGDSILVEASPYDKIWGISLAEEDPRALTMATWQGENRLGFVLTHVRETIKAEIAQGE